MASLVISPTSPSSGSWISPCPAARCLCVSIEAEAVELAELQPACVNRLVIRSRKELTIVNESKKPGGAACLKKALVGVNCY